MERQPATMEELLVMEHTGTQTLMNTKKSSLIHMEFLSFLDG